MSFYSLLSSFLSYVFTTIIYLFIFCIIVLIYKDIKRSSNDDSDFEVAESDENETENEEIEYTAILKHIKTRESAGLGVKLKYRIGEGPITIGRGEECDIVIPDVYLSQKHFEIYCKNSEWFLKDLKSKNGTYVNDIRVKKPVQLEDQDVISFGDIKFLFHPEQ